MIHTILRWSFIIVSVLALGPLAAMLLEGLRDGDGSTHATLLVSSSPMAYLAKGLAIAAFAAGMGVVGAKCFSRDTGLTAAGLVTAWAAWRVGGAEPILRTTAGPLVKIALEALALALPLLAGVFAAERFAKGREQGVTSLFTQIDRNTNPTHAAIACGLAAAALAGVGAYLVAISSIPGQRVFAAITAGIAAGGGAMVVGSMMGVRPGAFLPTLGVVIASIVAPLAAMILHGDKAQTAALASNILPLARPVSFDWTSGAYLGVPIGLSWAHSMLEGEHGKIKAGQPGATV